MRYLKYMFCTFAAIWLPVKILAALLAISSLLRAIASLGEIPLYVALVGVILMLIDLWQSKKTQDEKIWWMTLGVIFFPVVAPAYWFGHGLKNQKKEPIQSPQTTPVSAPR